MDSDSSEVVASVHVPSDQKAGLPLTKITKSNLLEEVKETG